MEKAEDTGGSNGVSVGDTVSLSRQVTEEDVEKFAEITGDDNPLHLDADRAVETMFGGRIAHGMLVAGLISGALAELGDGTTIYHTQNMNFVGPVYLGDRVSVEVEVEEEQAEDLYKVWTAAKSQDTDEVVIEGEAVVLIQ